MVAKGIEIANWNNWNWCVKHVYWPLRIYKDRVLYWNLQLLLSAGLPISMRLLWLLVMDVGIQTEHSFSVACFVCVAKVCMHAYTYIIYNVYHLYGCVSSALMIKDQTCPTATWPRLHDFGSVIIHTHNWHIIGAISSLVGYSPLTNTNQSLTIMVHHWYIPILAGYSPLTITITIIYRSFFTVGDGSWSWQLYQKMVTLHCPSMWAKGAQSEGVDISPPHWWHHWRPSGWLMLPTL